MLLITLPSVERGTTLVSLQGNAFFEISQLWGQEHNLQSKIWLKRPAYIPFIQQTQLSSCFRHLLFLGNHASGRL